MRMYACTAIAVASVVYALARCGCSDGRGARFAFVGTPRRGCWSLPELRRTMRTLTYSMVAGQPARADGSKRIEMTATTAAPTSHGKLLEWVQQWAGVLKPDRIEWCDGSEAEYERLCARLIESGTFTRLDPAKRPNSFYAHSDPADVARVEDRTFICSEHEIDAGP